MNAMLVIGGGQAGARAVRTLRSEGYAGRVTLVCDEAHVPYERPPLSKEILLGEQSAAYASIEDKAFYEAQRIEVLTSQRALAVDRTSRRVELASGLTLSYDRLLLATGSRPRKTDLPGEGLKGVHVLRRLDDSLALRDSLQPGANVVVVGGGFIGMEVAAAAVRHGCATTVLEAGPCILGRALPREVAQWLAKVHEDRGVKIEVDARILGFEARADDLSRVGIVRLVDGRRLQADAVVIGIGIVPNMELAEQAGLAIDNGIVVDDQCRTSDPLIFAAGDVTNHPNRLIGRRVRLESWKNAESQAVVAARNMVNLGVPYAELPWFWSDQYEHNVQALGAPVEWGRLVMRGTPLQGKGCVISLAPEGTIDGVVSINSARDVRPFRELMERGVVASANQLADTSVPLRSLMPTAVVC